LSTTLAATLALSSRRGATATTSAAATAATAALRQNEARNSKSD
jgi:hypothetical protein